MLLGGMSGMARGCVGSRLGLVSVMSWSWFGVAWVMSPVLSR